MEQENSPRESRVLWNGEPLPPASSPRASTGDDPGAYTGPGFAAAPGFPMPPGIPSMPPGNPSMPPGVPFAPAGPAQASPYAWPHPHPAPGVAPGPVAGGWGPPPPTPGTAYIDGRPPRSTLRTLGALAFTFGAFFFAALLLIAILVLTTRGNYTTQTSGVVDDVERAISTGPDLGDERTLPDSDGYDPNIEYAMCSYTVAYEVDGVSRTVEDDFNVNDDNCRAEPGQEKTVWFDPAQPEKATLSDPDGFPAAETFLGVSLAGFAINVVLTVLLWRRPKA